MQHFIGYRTFAALDSRGTDEQERDREGALRAEFTTLIPAAKRLRACELVLQRHHTDHGCALEYYLVFIPQTSFDFNGTGAPPPAGDKESADFQRDIADVSEECRNVKTRLVLAGSPILGQRDLQQDTEAMVDVRALRSLFRRHARQVVMPTPNGDLFLDLPPSPTKLPTGVACAITARVVSLTPVLTVHLRNLTWTPSRNTRHHMEFPLPAKAIARREGVSDAEVLRLLKGMDSGLPMRLGVEMDFDWASGAPSDLRIVSVTRPKNAKSGPGSARSRDRSN